MRIGPARTALDRDGTVRFEADAGVVVREYQVERSRLAFKLTSDKAVHITMHEFESGMLHASIDGKSAGPVNVQQGSGGLIVPAGEHNVELSQ